MFWDAHFPKFVYLGCQICLVFNSVLLVHTYTQTITSPVSPTSPTCPLPKMTHHDMSTLRNHTAPSPHHFKTLHSIRAVTYTILVKILYRPPPPVTTTHLLCKRRVIFCGERPIRSLILSFKFDTLALGDTERVNEGPIVGCILTDILFALSLLKVGVAIMSQT